MFEGSKIVMLKITQGTAALTLLLSLRGRARVIFLNLYTQRNRDTYTLPSRQPGKTNHHRKKSGT